MGRARRVLLLVVTLAAVGGCGSSVPECTPGEQEACSCPGGVSSVQVCAEDGKSFGACEACPGPGSTAAEQCAALMMTVCTPQECAKAIPGECAPLKDGTDCCTT
jgi:hypothetical protein